MSAEQPKIEQSNNEAELSLLFEQQYDNPEIVDIDQQKLEIVDLQPPQPKTEVPMVMVPGWAATPEVLRENAIILAKLGRRVILPNSPHGLEIEKTTGRNYPLAELRKTAALLQSIEHKQLNEVDAVSHSEAGIFLTIAALENSDKFRNLVLVSPAGLTGKDSFSRLASGFFHDIAGQTVKALLHEPNHLGKIGTAFWEAMKAIASDPKKTWEEVMAMVNYQIPELLAELKQQGHGISIIHGAQDKAFPMERVQQMVNSGLVDGFISVKGSHNELYLNPQPITEWVDHLLDAMEKKTPK